jgi:hypothetical protein
MSIDSGIESPFPFLRSPEIDSGVTFLEKGTTDRCESLTEVSIAVKVFYRPEIVAKEGHLPSKL